MIQEGYTKVCLVESRGITSLIIHPFSQYKGSMFKIPQIFSWNVVVTSPKLIEDIRKARDDELAEELVKQEKWAMVCRPKVGEMVVGGGFLGLWRRMEPATLDQPDPGAPEV